MPKEITHIIPPFTDCPYLTADKKYPIIRFLRKETVIKTACVIIEDDTGTEITTELKESAHINGKSFTKFYS